MRALWVLLLMAGVIGFGGLAIMMVFAIPIGPNLVITSRGIWPVLAFLQPVRAVRVSS